MHSIHNASHISDMVEWCDICAHNIKAIGYWIHT